MSPRVLIVTQHIGIGGLERMIAVLATSLKKRMISEPAIFCYNHSLRDYPVTMLPILDAEKIPHEVFKKSKGFSVNVLWRMVRFMRANRSQLVHTQCLGGLIYAAILKLLRFGKLKIVHTQHSFIHLKVAKRYALYEKFFTRFVDELTVVSNDTRETYLKFGFPKENVRVVENGVSFVDAPVLDRAERTEKRANVISTLGQHIAGQLKRYETDRWILYLARLHPEKGQDHAFSLWSELDPKVRESSVLVIVGPESYPGELDRLLTCKQRAADSERIVFAGGTTSPKLWLECADVFVSCSEFEGMPLGPLEACGAGLPLVLTSIPGHGFLADYSEQFPLWDWKAGARALERTLRRVEADGPSYFEQLWERSRGLVKRFSIETMADTYAEIYANVLSR